MCFQLLAKLATFDKELYVIDFFNQKETDLLQEKEVKLLAHYRQLVHNVHERKAKRLHNLKTSATLERTRSYQAQGSENKDKWLEIRSGCDTLFKSLEDELK